MERIYFEYAQPINNSKYVKIAELQNYLFIILEYVQFAKLQIAKTKIAGQITNDTQVTCTNVASMYKTRTICPTNHFPRTEMIISHIFYFVHRFLVSSVLGKSLVERKYQRPS